MLIFSLPGRNEKSFLCHLSHRKEQKSNFDPQRYVNGQQDEHRLAQYRGIPSKAESQEGMSIERLFTLVGTLGEGKGLFGD